MKIKFLLSTLFIFLVSTASAKYVNYTSVATDTLKKGKNYILFSKSANIDRVDFTKSKKAKENKIYIRLGYPAPVPGSNAINGTVMQSNRKYVEDKDLPIFDKIEILKGNYKDIKLAKESKNKNLFTITDLEFPIRLKLTTGQDVIDLELLEPGEWDIQIELKNN